MEQGKQAAHRHAPAAKENQMGGDSMRMTVEERERVLTQSLVKLLDLYDNSCTVADFSEQWIEAIKSARAALTRMAGAPAD